jgi:hypothetical protein
MARVRILRKALQLKFKERDMGTTWFRRYQEERKE